VPKVLHVSCFLFEQGMNIDIGGIMTAKTRREINNLHHVASSISKKLFTHLFNYIVYRVVQNVPACRANTSAMFVSQVHL
jgi:hypothetical protein